jgi:hypothetical protein
MNILCSGNKTHISACKGKLAIGNMLTFDVDTYKEMVVLTLPDGNQVDLTERQINKLIKNFKIMKDIIKEEKGRNHICRGIGDPYQVITTNPNSPRLFNPDGSLNV